eukprot:3730047-Rhodomonas_salina.1
MLGMEGEKQYEMTVCFRLWSKFFTKEALQKRAGNCAPYLEVMWYWDCYQLPTAQPLCTRVLVPHGECEDKEV